MNPLLFRYLRGVNGIVVVRQRVVPARESRVVARTVHKPIELFEAVVGGEVGHRAISNVRLAPPVALVPHPVELLSYPRPAEV